MLIRIHPKNPGHRQIRIVADILRQGGVVIYPTDTVYGLGCDIFNSKAVEKVARIKGVNAAKANFSIICHNLSNLTSYTRPLDNHVFKLMKKLLPGPYTFIVAANNSVPRLFKNKKKTLGIRIPKHSIPLELVKELGNPILTTSIHDIDQIIDYTTSPELIHENMGAQVDAVIDGGYGHNVPSTVIDCTGAKPEVVRNGLGEFEE